MWLLIVSALRKWRVQIFVMCVLGGGLILPFDALRAKLFDQYNRWSPRIDSQAHVAIIDIDEASLKALGQFPWPRDYLATLLARATAAGARAVAFDILFVEPDRTDPNTIIPLWLERTRNNRLRSNIQKILHDVAFLPSPDNVFAQQLSTTPAIVAMALATEAEIDHRTQNISSGKIATHIADGAHIPFPRQAGIRTNFPQIQQAVQGKNQGIGVINTHIDNDGLIREVPMVFALEDGRLYPGLAVEAVRVARGESTSVLNIAKTAPPMLNIGTQNIPLSRNGTIRPHYSRSPHNTPQQTSHDPIIRIPAWKFIKPDPQYPPSKYDLKNKIVFVGASAAGLNDIRAHPLNPTADGVEIHAEIAQMLMAGHLLSRPPAARIIEIIGGAGLGIIILTLLHHRISWGIASYLVAMSTIAGMGWGLYVKMQMLIDPLTPALAISASVLLALGGQFAVTTRERKFIRTAFTHYVPAPVLTRLLAQTDTLTLGGEIRDMTILFADIRGFSTIAEKFAHAPDRLTLLINRFLTHMTAIIQTHGGTIDKYIGDSVMAFWNAPLAHPEHSLAAVRAALAMTTAQSAINHELRHTPALAEFWDGDLNMGIGISSGACLVGNIGAEQRFNYSAMGDAVNIAARLETATKTYGMPILVSHSCRVASADYAYLEIDNARLRGRTQTTKIFALLGDTKFARQPAFQKHIQAQARLLAAMRAQDWTQVNAYANALQKTYPEYDTYYRMIQTRYKDTDSPASLPEYAYGS